MEHPEKWEELCRVRKRRAELDVVAGGAVVSSSARRRRWYDDTPGTARSLPYPLPLGCCPVHADVTTFDFEALGKVVQFDVVVIDPPWAISGESRGVELSYKTLTDADISRLPIRHLQTDGMLFLWTVNSRMPSAIRMMKEWGYDFVTFVDWIKTHRSGKLAAGNGYYLQHAKEACLVGVKGRGGGGGGRLPSDVIIGHRMEPSRKPDTLYSVVEQIFGQQGKYLEIFGRPHNVRAGWVTIGDDL